MGEVRARVGAGAIRNFEAFEIGDQMSGLGPLAEWTASLGDVL